MPGRADPGLPPAQACPRRLHLALKSSIQKAHVVSPDETGWKVEGERAWLWVFASVEVTVYAIMPGRGFEEAASVLGADFSGTLARDGWAPYRKTLASVLDAIAPER